MIQIGYLATLDHEQFLPDRGRPLVDWRHMCVPVALFLPWWWGDLPRYLRIRSALSGFLLAMWLNVLLLTVPWLGLYPSLPTAWVGMAVGGSTDSGPTFYLPIMAANILLWSAVGWCAPSLIRWLQSPQRISQ